MGEWDEIVDALELIEHHPESAEARRGQIRSGTESLWKVDTRTPVSILWRMEDDEPTVVEVMAWPPQ